MVPVTIPNPSVTPVTGGCGPRAIRFAPAVSEKPVTETPGGLRPKSPVIRVAPVFVTVVVPRTAKLADEPSGGAVACAQHRLPVLNMQITNKTFFISKLLGWICLHRR
jgi:hypothetical protein